MVMREFGDLSLYDRVPPLGDGLTHDELLALEFATVTAPYGEVREFVLENARVRPGFRELVDRYDPLVISGTFHELIEPVLEREGVAVRLLANRVEPRPDGWHVVLRDGAVCDSCGEGCKRAALPAGRGRLRRRRLLGPLRGARRLAGVRARRAGRVSRRRARGVHPFEDLEDVARGLG